MTEHLEPCITRFVSVFLSFGHRFITMSNITLYLYSCYSERAMHMNFNNLTKIPSLPFLPGGILTVDLYWVHVQPHKSEYDIFQSNFDRSCFNASDFSNCFNLAVKVGLGSAIFL